MIRTEPNPENEQGPGLGLTKQTKPVVNVEATEDDKKMAIRLNDKTDPKAKAVVKEYISSKVQKLLNSKILQPEVKKIIDDIMSQHIPQI